MYTDMPVVIGVHWIFGDCMKIIYTKLTFRMKYLCYETLSKLHVRSRDVTSNYLCPGRFLKYFCHFVIDEFDINRSHLVFLLEFLDGEFDVF